ncbi:MAG: LpxL/LpxP family Kdo(2)-lipid IV(A) lauroyl/palmitoleoyl acyltransferase [Gammaproteobacteria bacterium]|nr:LpxL/LpxP family Kdo(2)-lipid IV(A) lauroyl/palmitoleoyl acyltransferase [Gammaproteobacteria bacterium]
MSDMNNKIFSLEFLKPQYWALWIILLLLRILVLLPFPILIKLGEGLGTLLYHLNIKHRRIAEANIAAAFPELEANKQKELVKGTIKGTMITLFELPLFWWGSNRRLRKRFEIEGMENMQKVLAQGHGAILMGGHFTPMLMCGRMLAMDLPFNILVMPAKNKLFEAIMHHYRERFYHGIINSHDIRTMVKALKNNEICWYSPDQDLGGNNIVFAPFMGIQTATITATSRLAKLSKSPIVPINFERTKNNRGYRLKILPAWDNFPSGDDIEDATRVNVFLEQHIQKVPDQYLWVHRRFKTRPAGEPSIYK